MTTTEPAPAAAVGRLTGGLLRRNLSVVAVSYAVGSVAGFATQSVMGRTLGSRTYGVYVTGLALATTFSVVQEVAGPAWLVRTAAQSAGRYRDLAGAVLSFRAVAGAVVVAVSLAVAAALGMTGNGLVVVVLLAVVAGLNAVLRALRAGLQAAERMPASAGLAMTNSVATAAVMSTLVAIGAGLVAAVVASALVSAVLVPVAWWCLEPRMRPGLTARLRPLVAAASESFPFTAVATLSTVLAYADTLVIRAVLGNGGTGLYGAAWRLLTVLLWVPSIVLDAVLRGLSAAAVQDPRHFRDLVDRAAAAMLLLGLPLAAAGSLVARPVFVLVFGSGFAAGADAFRILLWSLPLSFPSWIIVEAVLVGGRPASIGWLLGATVAGNVIANIVVVPRYGIEGSAWVTIATEAAVLVGAVVLLHRSGASPRWVLAAAPAAALALVTVASVAPLTDQPLAMPLLAGTGAFAAGAALLWWVSRSTDWGARLLLSPRRVTR